MKKEEKVYIKKVINHFIDFYKFDLSPYNKVYKIWFEKGLYSEIIIDFLRKVKIPANIRLIKKSTRTKEEPFCVGYINLNIKKPIFFLSKEFKERRFEICIDPTRYEQFETFICTLIHELSHLVLHSTFNEYRMSEVATDLFVMAFGLYEEAHYIALHKKDSKGYITSEQVEFAKSYISLKRGACTTTGFQKIFNQVKLQLLRS